jgi:hypothetical protein
MNAVPRPRPVLKVAKTKTTLLLALARAIYTAMLAAVARFPTPVPTLVILLAQIAALDLAQRAVGPGNKAATAARNVARELLWASLESLRSYVQFTADTSTDNPVLVIKSSGFNVALPPSVAKPVLAAKLPGLPGVVNLTANAKVLAAGSTKRPTYNWQYSLDGGHTWVTVSGTPRARTTITGLPPLTACSFRVSVTLGTTVEPWSQVVTISTH